MALRPREPTPSSSLIDAPGLAVAARLATVGARQAVYARLTHAEDGGARADWSTSADTFDGTGSAPLAIQPAWAIGVSYWRATISERGRLRIRPHDGLPMPLTYAYLGNVVGVALPEGLTDSGVIVLGIRDDGQPVPNRWTLSAAVVITA